MAPSATLQDIAKRYSTRCDAYGNCWNEGSGWDSWGRWVLLGALVIIAFLFVLAASCIRRRRIRKGLPPPRYTPGWMGAKPPQQQPYYQNYNQGYNNNGAYGGGQGYYQPAPPYQASNQGYYNNGQQTGVELQQPSQSYQPARATEDTYAPPAGPPPGKK